MIKITSKFPREILNEIKYRGLEFNLIRVDYINRGSPNNIANVYGNHIINLNKFYMEIFKGIEPTCIPYHRIRKIFYNDKEVFSRL